MELVSEWYWEKQDEEAAKAEMAASGGTSGSEERSAPEAPPATRNEPSEGEPEKGLPTTRPAWRTNHKGLVKSCSKVMEVKTA